MKIRKIFNFLLFYFIFGTYIHAQENQNLKPEEIAEQQLEILDKDVNLDDFQKIEIRDLMIESAKNVKTAIDNGIDENNLRFIIENNARELNENLKKILLPEQFEKYMKLQREKAIEQEKPKKKKKKRINN